MKKMMWVIVAMACVFGLTWLPAVQAQEITPQQIVDQVNGAVNLIAEKGEAEAFPLLTDPNGDWVKGDLYVFVYDLEGTIQAHLNKKLEGKNLMKVKDTKGNVFAADFVRIAKSDKGEGWTEYWWPKPGQKEASLKVSFIKKVPGKDLLVGVGVYDMTMEDARKATGIE